MPITLQAQSHTFTPYQNQLNSAAPDGTPVPIAPAWSGSTPAVLDYASTGPHQVNWAQYASGTTGEPLTYSLLSTRAGITITSGGLMTIDAPGSSGSVTVRVSDSALSADHVVTITVPAAQTSLATYLIPASTATRTFNASSAATGFAGGPWRTVSGVTRQPQAGDVIEFAGGTHGRLTLSNFVGTLARPYLFRNAAGQVVRINGATNSISFVAYACQNVTFDGSNGGTPYGFLLTQANSSIVPSHYFKPNNFCRNIKWRHFEVAGPYSVPPFASASNIGMSGHDETLKRTDHPGVYQVDGLVFEHFYCHHTGGEAFYLGPNFYNSPNPGTCPIRGVVIRHGLIAHTGRGGAQIKACWLPATDAAFDAEAAAYAAQIHDVVVHHTANRGTNETETGHGHNLGMGGPGRIYNCRVADSGEAGIKCYVMNGPPANRRFTHGVASGETIPPVNDPHYGPFDAFEVVAFNNVVLRSGSIEGPYYGNAPGITMGGETDNYGMATVPLRPKQYSNTVVDAEDAGCSAGSYVAGGGFIKNNLIIAAGGAAISWGGTASNSLNVTSGSPTTLFVDYPNDDLALAQPTAQRAQGVRGIDYSATDIEGLARGTGSVNATAAQPDVGACEYEE